MSTGSLRSSSLGPYRVVDFVGAGGMGEVFRAVHTLSGRVVALKVVTAAGRDASLLERFRNEARIHATLHHPGVATMFEWFEADGLACIAMEFVDGETLEHRLGTRGPYSLLEGLRIFAAVVDAVGYVHQRGVIHRDLKSNNVKVTESGVVKLLDFGIAKSGASPKLTADGNVIGTLHYLSPEQLRTGQAEPRSDIWALGVLLYELLTGRLPFEGGALGVLTERLLKGLFQPATQLNPHLPREVDRVIARCLRVNVAERYASAEALLTDVRSLLPGEPATPPTPRSADLKQLSSRVRFRGAAGALLAAAATTATLIAIAISAPHQPSGGGTTTQLPPDSTQVSPAASEVGSLAFPAPGESGREPQRWAPSADAMSPTPDELRVGNGEVLQTALLQVPGDLVADVIHRGRIVGKTPFLVRAPVGEEVQLILRRAGFEDEVVRVTITELPQQYQHVLRPIVLRDSQFFAAHVRRSGRLCCVPAHREDPIHVA